jgi:predicted acylesterase/phospholipase RssA
LTWQSHPLPKRKTALVLAGGGVTGAVFELGALRALEDWLVPTGHRATDFDIYVGTSAGAILGSLLANGLATDDLYQLLADRHPALRGLRQSDVFRWNFRGLGRWAGQLPGRLARAAAASARQRSLSPLLRALSDAAPPGLYDGLALADYLRQVYATFGGSDHFEALRRELYLVATCLNTGERTVFGRGQQAGATISQAVAASTALPFVYAPVRVGDEWFVDGGLRGNASVDVAVEQGAELIVVVNPLVPPVVGEPGSEHDPTGGVGWRALRISSHAGLHYHLKHLRRRHPEVDFVLIEPRPDDAEFLTVPAMDFGARQHLLDHARRRVRQHLDENYAAIAAVLARHGLRLPPPDHQPLAEQASAAAPGPTTGAQHEPAGHIAWPRQAHAGHTGARAPRRRHPAAQPVNAKGESS